MKIDLTEYFIFSPYFANNENLGKAELETLNQKAEKLPEEIRSLLLDTEVAEAIKNTMARYNLTEKQAIILAVLVRRIFFKDAAKNQLTNDIIKYANASPQIAEELVRYLEENVFAKTPSGPAAESPTASRPQTQGSVINLKR